LLMLLFQSLGWPRFRLLLLLLLLLLLAVAYSAAVPCPPSA
jgi:hypothetical protein